MNCINFNCKRIINITKLSCRNIFNFKISHNKMYKKSIFVYKSINSVCRFATKNVFGTIHVVKKKKNNKFFLV